MSISESPIKATFYGEVHHHTYICVAMNRDEHGSGLDRTGSGLRPFFAGAELDRNAIFLNIGGTGLDRTAKFFVVLMWLF